MRRGWVEQLGRLLNERMWWVDVRREERGVRFAVMIFERGCVIRMRMKGSRFGVEIR